MTLFQFLDHAITSGFLFNHCAATVAAAAGAFNRPAQAKSRFVVHLCKYFCNMLQVDGGAKQPARPLLPVAGSNMSAHLHGRVCKKVAATSRC